MAELWDAERGIGRRELRGYRALGASGRGQDVSPRRLLPSRSAVAAAASFAVLLVGAAAVLRGAHRQPAASADVQSHSQLRAFSFPTLPFLQGEPAAPEPEEPQLETPPPTGDAEYGAALPGAGGSSGQPSAHAWQTQDPSFASRAPVTDLPSAYGGQPAAYTDEASAYPDQASSGAAQRQGYDPAYAPAYAAPSSDGSSTAYFPQGASYPSQAADGGTAVQSYGVAAAAAAQTYDYGSPSPPPTAYGSASPAADVPPTAYGSPSPPPTAYGSTSPAAQAYDYGSASPAADGSGYAGPATYAGPAMSAEAYGSGSGYASPSTSAETYGADPGDGFATTLSPSQTDYGYGTDGGSQASSSLPENVYGYYGALGGGTEITTTTTTTREAVSLFCFALMMPEGYEKGLLQTLYNRSASVFACDEYSIFSDGKLKLAHGLVTEDVGSTKCEYGGPFYLALNSEVFIRVWKRVIEDRAFARHGWTAKVDPDAVFLPHRLLALVQDSDGDANVYLNNCDQGLHGPIEVIARGGMRMFAEGIDDCAKELKKEFSEGGEDVFLRHCLGMLNISRVDNFQLLSEDRCMWENPPKDGCISGKVAFHPFKSEDSYLRCLEEAEAHPPKPNTTNVTNATNATLRRGGGDDSVVVDDRRGSSDPRSGADG